ncbi:MAG: hypothetical protein GY787_23750 [Alteromonadales bacterium]|nr:hypothetical protein [Alteromonadales bacterium]
MSLDDSKQDELGLLTQAFNQFVMKLEGIIKEQKQIALNFMIMQSNYRT